MARTGSRAVALAALATAVLLWAPPAARADQVISLRSSFEGQAVTATLPVPDGWQARRGRAGVTLTAPSSRPGCSHVLWLGLHQLYVAPTVTPDAWVRTRLQSRGSIRASAMLGDQSWAVAMRDGARASSGLAARIVNNGRYGPVMAEVPASAALTRGCPGRQAGRAAARLGRILSQVGLTATRRRRARSS